MFLVFIHSYVTIRPDNQYDTKPHGFRFHSSTTENYFQISIGKLSSKQVALADTSRTNSRNTYKRVTSELPPQCHHMFL